MLLICCIELDKGQNFMVYNNVQIQNYHHMPCLDNIDILLFTTYFAHIRIIRS